MQAPRLARLGAVHRRRVLVAVAVVAAAALAYDLGDLVAHLRHHDVPHLAAAPAQRLDVLSYAWCRHLVSLSP
jgi:hypothetical protein